MNQGNPEPLDFERKTLPAWLVEVFEAAKRDYESLPEWARPVVTRPMSAGV